MLVIFKPTKMKYKNPNNGNYVGVNTVTDEVTRSVINDWLDEHPEATTTVQDNNLITEKIIPELHQKIDSTAQYIFPKNFWTNFVNSISIILI